MVNYFIRLDDLCPTNDRSKWQRFFDLFDRYNIKPLIAVIPDNKDPKLQITEPDPNFWDWVRSLQDKGYILAMHGYEHKYITDKPGMMKYNYRSEFAGLPLSIQEAKIKEAQQIFDREQVKTEVFIAPAHSFDKNTLLAIKRNSTVKVISDGLLDVPYEKDGFKWVPVQLAEAMEKENGTWTFNYHPETTRDVKFKELEAFIEKHHDKFGDFKKLQYVDYTLARYLTETFKINKRWFKRTAKAYLKK